ncbi:PREDICTED: pleckstrin homology-like domain family A member 2 [Nipponia nippon]|uniref:pleckstrin homology-like domain family A member 2 n=1 Tax=Nipponia nippon TaxID=128390 RepID=UPI0005119E02|nr:PREDICTED: pleckstrin homology-like domain family A member 2 [Nipponia nippon]
MKMQAEVIREGELEKRSDSLFQLWKKKLVVLTKDSLSLFPDGHKRAKGKELGFGSILKVDCVERTGKYIYFTIVTKDRKEIDFRCPDQSCWNASITMALIDFQNKRAIQDFKSRQEMEQAAGAQAYHWMINQIKCLGLKWDRVPMKESEEESWKQLGFLQAGGGC